MYNNQSQTYNNNNNNQNQAPNNMQQQNYNGWTQQQQQPQQYQQYNQQSYFPQRQQQQYNQQSYLQQQQQQQYNQQSYLQQQQQAQQYNQQSYLQQQQQPQYQHQQQPQYQQQQQQHYFSWVQQPQQPQHPQYQQYPPQNPQYQQYPPQPPQNPQYPQQYPPQPQYQQQQQQQHRQQSPPQPPQYPQQNNQQNFPQTQSALGYGTPPPGNNVTGYSTLQPNQAHPYQPPPRSTFTDGFGNQSSVSVSHNPNAWPSGKEFYDLLMKISHVDENTKSELITKEWDYERWHSMYLKAKSERNHEKVKKLNMLAYLYTKNNKNASGKAPQSVKIDNIPPVGVSYKYSSTTVCVLNIDVVDALISIHNKYKRDRIACLNIANSKRPGGNIKNGEVAQEETLFIATNISISLHDDCGLYPIEKKEMIYTSGVTVLRRGVKDGYEFLPLKDMFTIDVASVAATKDDNLDGKNFMIMRNKVEQLVAKCIESGVETLVLGALGCGNFNNPPEKVAAIFRAILTQYAGYFKTVYFAISDPSKEIISVFAKELLKKEPTAITFALTREFRTAESAERDMGVSYALWKGEMFSMGSHLPLCHYGGKCEKWGDPDHSGKYQHPPKCQFGLECKEEDHLHRMLFCHKLVCPNAGECEIYYKDAGHREAFIHPRECVNGVNCTNTDQKHLHEFIHFPSCENGIDCKMLSDPNHAGQFRHIKKKCPNDTKCPLFMNSEHTRIYSHSFNTPCKDTPFVCVDCSEEHQNEFSHVCPAGPFCPKIGDSRHLRNFIHAGAICKHGADCTDITEVHIASFFHPGVPIFREPCSETWCKNFEPQHRREFSHHRNDVEHTPIVMINTRDPDHERNESYGNFNANPEWHMDAEANARKLIEETDVYLGGAGKVDMNSPNIQRIVKWFKDCRPMHMCSCSVFLSILNLGGITSSHVLKNLWLDKKNITNTIIHSPRFASLNVGEPDRAEKIKVIKRYLKLYIKKIQSDMREDFTAEAIKYDGKKNAGKKSFESDSDLTATVQKTEKTNEKNIEELKEIGVGLEGILEDGGREKLEGMANKIVEDIKNVLLNLPGCQSKGDSDPRLDFTAFTVVGPHYHDYGKGEVVLVLRPEIMFHPDYFDTPFSALMYSLGLAGNKNWGSGRFNVKHKLDRTSWHPNEGDWGNGGDADFFSSKMHRTAPSYYEAFTKEWLCRVKYYLGIEPGDATLENVTDVWCGFNAHYVTEGHLPGKTPVEYIEAVIILQSAYNEAIKNDLGKAFLDKYQAAGKLIIITSDNSEDVNRATGDYIINTRLDPIDYPSGFCFSLCNEHDNFMPFSLDKSSEIVHFSFMAHGAPFCVAVNNIGDFRGTEDMPRKAFTFRIGSTTSNNVCECLSAASFNVAPMSCSSSSPIHYVSDFNAGCPLNAFVHYMVKIDYNAGLATLSHWGPSSVYGRSVVRIELERGVRYSHISFTSLKEEYGNTVIWNVREDKKPRFVVGIDNSPIQIQVQSPPPQFQIQVHPPQPQIQHPPPPPQFQIQGQPPPPPPQIQIQVQPKVQQQPSKLGVPICSNPFSCIDRSPDHRNNFAHACVYGSRCKHKNDPSHYNNHFHLKERRICDDDRSCQLIRDPAHRFQYRHTGRNRDWCYMVPCKYADKCRDTTDEKHSLNYSHTPFDFPAVTQDMIEEIMN